MNIIITCTICNKKLTGRQTKYCSTKCKGKDTNNKFQSYQHQKERGTSRKKILVTSLGGKCEICGYNKNLAALCFHHKDPSDKSIELDMRALSNNSWETICQEANKCKLLCHNCHMEEHHPHLFLK